MFIFYNLRFLGVCSPSPRVFTIFSGFPDTYPSLTDDIMG